MKTVLALWALILAGFIGWVLNIVAIFHAGPIAEWTAVVLVRVIGVFVPPVGAVMGWI